jgi:subtilisin family serine protease
VPVRAWRFKSSHPHLVPATRFLLAALVAAVVLSGDAGAAGPPVALTEVVVTLGAPPLAAFGRTLHSPAHAEYARELAGAQAVLERRVVATLPGARIHWRYHLVANGFSVVLPKGEVAALARVPGVARVWPDLTYRALATTESTGPAASGVQEIGAEQLWGPDQQTAGQGMKIGIIDDGVDAAHPYFDPAGYAYPPGFPRGQTEAATPKVIVQRTFAPAAPAYRYANAPFDPTQSFHATHVAGIAAGDPTLVHGQTISGVAPKAYIGNYKALTIPTPEFGLDGNSAEIAAAVEAAVADGMNVVNLSLGEPEVDPARDLVVSALDAAAAAGVVPVVAAGNDFDDFGYGSITSPANAPAAISVAAVDLGDHIADFSSAGPTPVSLAFKPDVSAPGVSILSSLPASDGTWGLESGTSMATPHVAGAVALLEQRHPTWTPAEIKSALVQTGSPVETSAGKEALAMREGGGLIDLPRADDPLLFAAPTSLSFGELAPHATSAEPVSLADAGGGTGTWNVTVDQQLGSGTIAVPPTVSVPGTLTVTATAGAVPGDDTGFVVLARGSDVRRIPYWFDVSAPALTGPRPLLTKPGVVHGTTIDAPSRVTVYRYPTAGDVTYRGPERAYRIVIRQPVANFGAVVLRGNVTPHVVFDGHEDHLTGYAGLPIDLNPYRASYGARIPVAGAVLPGPGTYDLVFDSRSPGAAGPFTFRWWVNDVTPPHLRVLSVRGGISIAATDTGSGVDPSSVVARLDGSLVQASYANGVFHVHASKGRHRVVISVGDYEETKNMEDVPPILPNTATLTSTVTVR